MDKRLFVTDLDGTLLDHEKRIPAEVRQVIEAYVASGGYFTIATGRTEVCCGLAADHVPINAPAVLYNGACVMDLKTGKVLWDCALEAEAYRPILRRIMEVFPEICIEIFAYGPQILVNPNATMDPYIIREHQQYRQMPLEETPERWLKILFSAPHEVLTQLVAFLEENKEAYPACSTMFSADYYYEVLPRGCTKASGVRVLADLMQIDRADVAAMGDHLNDVQMLRWAGHPYAPATAHEAVRSISRVTRKNNNEGAVAEAIADYLSK